MFYFQTDIPGSVLKTFENMFPSVREHSWEMVDGNYHARFEHENESTVAIFSTKGKWLKTKVLTPNDLPSTAFKEIDNIIEGAYINLIYFVESSDGNEFYEVHLESESSQWIMEISIEGEIISHEEFPMYEEEDF